MVTFNNDGFTITYKSNTPVEDFLELKATILNLLSAQNPEMGTDSYYVLQLLRSMEPDRKLYQKLEAFF